MNYEMKNKPIEVNNLRYAVIYKYTNLINGKSYIGQSINYIDRHKKHILSAFNPKRKDYNNLLHKAIRKYGLDNFRYEILFACNCPQEFVNEVLDKQEKYYIKLFNTYGNGYNLTEGGGGSIRKHTKEENEKHSKQLKGMFEGAKNPFYGKTWNVNQREANQTKVIKYDLDGNYVGEYDSLKDAALSVGKNHSGNISNCCVGKRNNAYGFRWKYKD